MKKLLQQVNDLPGVMGSMVMTEDGLPAASLLGSGLDEECVAAFASSSRLAVSRAAIHCGEGEPQEVVLESEGGNLLLIGIDGATLAVITHPGLEMNTGLVEIRSIARRLSEALKIRI
jgi:predicted regulator of Ras-like GTPase activity (Roadblock/LC7/MglB family)